MAGQDSVNATVIRSPNGFLVLPISFHFFFCCQFFFCCHFFFLFLQNKNVCIHFYPVANKRLFSPVLLFDGHEKKERRRKLPYFYLVLYIVSINLNGFSLDSYRKLAQSSRFSQLGHGRCKRVHLAHFPAT